MVRARLRPLPQSPSQLLDLVARFVDCLSPLVNRSVPHGVVERARIGEDDVVVTPILRDSAGWLLVQLSVN